MRRIILMLTAIAGLMIAQLSFAECGGHHGCGDHQGMMNKADNVMDDGMHDMKKVKDDSKRDMKNMIDKHDANEVHGNKIGDDSMHHGGCGRHE